MLDCNHMIILSTTFVIASGELYVITKRFPTLFYTNLLRAVENQIRNEGATARLSLINYQNEVIKDNVEI